jgi:hypothetical protein
MATDPASHPTPRPTPRSTEDLFNVIYEQCSYINWRADEIKAAQVQIELAARELQAGGSGTTPPVEPPVDPPIDPVEPPIDPPGNVADAIKLGPSNLQYLGAFRLPHGVPPGCAYGFDYALTGLAFNPQHHSLFINNHVYEQKTAEVTIPTPTLDLSQLPVASYLQHPVDICEGTRQNLLAGGAPYWDACQIGDLLCYGDKIIATSYIFYDGGHQAVLSHCYSNRLVSEHGDLRGFFDVGQIGAGFVAGWMCHVPPEWQAAIGGPALTGQGCLSIISRTSYGPSAFVFDPQHLPNAGGTVAATPLVYYDQAHPTLGMWEQQDHVNDVFNMATKINGLVFPTGSRTVLFFGRQGLGIPCYGDVVAYGGHCEDPADYNKGCHAYPYKVWVWAYDANDLVAVKDGQRQPWDVVPYQVWGLDLPTETPKNEVQGVAYDPATQRIYLSQTDAAYLAPGQNPYDKSPIIHTFQLVGSSGRGRLPRR